MRQFDVFTNPSVESRDFAPFVVALQSHHLPLDSTVVAPIVTDSAGFSLDLPVEIGGRWLHIAMAELANVPTRSLGRALTNLAAHEDAIRRGLDRLFTGF